EEEAKHVEHGRVMTPEQMRDFVDNTTSYNGKALTMKLRYDAASPLTQEEVNSIAGTIVPFHGIGKVHDSVFQFDMKILIPNRLPVPRLSGIDQAVVTFECSEGQLMSGNRAKKI